MTPYVAARFPLRLSIGPGRIHAAAETQRPAEPFRIVTACGMDITTKPQQAHGIGPTCRDCKRQ